jgi:hypothetical protein
MYMNMKEKLKLEKTFSLFICDPCNFKCSQKCDWDRHILRAKHINLQKPIEILHKKTYKCKCDKIYKHSSTFYAHKKKCNIVLKSIISSEEPTDKELIMMLIKKNDELQTTMMEQQTIMMEVIKNGTHNTTNTNSHNKAFNLNFFLNETCKDAMNITEFVNSIQLQISDLEKMGEVGYVEGLTSIISRNLKALDVNMRPVHCTDKKREIMYIKDETKWEKDEENTKMHKMVRNVAFENQRQILKYKEIHPDCGKSSSKYSDPYNKILVECMGGAGDNDFEKEEKIISKISKCVLVEKDI